MTLLLNDKPQIVGPGLTQVETWQAYKTRGNDDLRPRVRDGYTRNEEASYFLWAREIKGNIEYGLTAPASVIMNEARRSISDYKLRQEFVEQYDSRLLAELVTDIERRASTKDLRDQADALLEGRQKALEERRQINKELQEALERAARAEKVAVVFDALAQVLTVGQLGANLAAEFPDQANKISKAGTTSELKSILESLMSDAKTQGDAVAGRVRVNEDKERNLRLEELQVIRLQKINIDEIPGVLP